MRWPNVKSRVDPIDCGQDLEHLSPGDYLREFADPVNIITTPSILITGHMYPLHWSKREEIIPALLSMHVFKKHQLRSMDHLFYIYSFVDQMK